MKTHRIKTICLTFLFAILMPVFPLYADKNDLTVRKSVGRVLLNSKDGNPFRIQEGNYPYTKGMEILTLSEGQIVLKIKDDYEVRLKEDSIVRFGSGKSIFFSRGTIGIKSSLNPVIFKTPHLEGKLNKGTIVIKTNPILTRICLIDGELEVEKAGKSIKMSKGSEIAASDTKLSQEYKRTAELRFTWYWKENPEEEPTFN
jgi:hypothetical protein